MELYVWSAASVAVAALVNAGAKHFTDSSPGSPVAELIIHHLAIWSPWILVIPVLILLVERPGLRPRVSYTAHAAVALAATVAHAALYDAWSSPLLMVVYGSLLFGVVRNASAITHLTADEEGRLRTATWDRQRQPGSKLEGLTGPVLVYDPESLRILAANDAAAAQYGVSLPQIVSRSITDLHAEMDYPVALRGMRRQQLPIWCERQWHRDANGRRFEVEITNHAVIFDGRWARMMIITDVSAAEAALERLAESELKFRSIFENALVGIFRSTPNGRFLMLNPAAAAMLGYRDPEEAMAFTQIAQLYVEDSGRAAFLEALEAADQVSGWIARLRRVDGSVIVVSEYARAVRDSRGKVKFIEGTIKDITAEVAAQEALKDSERRAADLRLSLAHAQLRALKLQLKPHFLFNILNTAAMMIRTGNDKGANRVVTLLGDLFRRLLELEDDEKVTLERELGFVDLYLNLERYRYEDRIQLSRQVSADLLAARVPALILQPIFENAIKHGVARMSGPCRIDLRVAREGESLRIELRNDARPEPSDAVGCGVGIANTTARLKEMYGSAARFALESVPGGFKAVLVMPLEEGA